MLLTLLLPPASLVPPPAQFEADGKVEVRLGNCERRLVNDDVAGGIDAAMAASVATTWVQPTVSATGPTVLLSCAAEGGLNPDNNNDETDAEVNAEQICEGSRGSSAEASLRFRSI